MPSGLDACTHSQLPSHLFYWPTYLSVRLSVCVRGSSDFSSVTTALAHRPGAAASTPGPVARASQPPPHTGPLTGVCSAATASRRTAAGGPLLSSIGSAAGIYPPPRHPHPAAEVVTTAAVSPLMRPSVGGSGARHRSFLVVLAPLEHLHRDAGLLTQIPQRLLVVDLARPEGTDGDGGTVASGNAGRGTGSSDDSGGIGKALFRTFDGGFEVGSGSDSGSGHTTQLCRGAMGRRGQGMELESYHHLHLLTRMPAACRVLLSGACLCLARGSSRECSKQRRV
ncbi:hypothetical protein Vretifemale_8463 [Volvox reticuliferus]|uniref:Uncharacterized protein n=1 Tax=Volvox reticuliferus TaxID=1737510 RepID=A0A8J4CCJ6_9CHLO|nr:hypothetical protein Vretifemale_8463 [Volvox reticuliferus]